MTKQHTLHLLAYRNFIIRNCFRSQQNEYTGRYQIENRKTARYCWIELNKFIKKRRMGEPIAAIYRTFSQKGPWVFSFICP